MAKSIRYPLPADARVNGRPVASAEIFPEQSPQGEFWRWRIVDVRGREYLDGGNFVSREQALADLATAFDPAPGTASPEGAQGSAKSPTTACKSAC